MRRVIALLNLAGVAPELRTPAKDGLPRAIASASAMITADG